MSNMPDPFSRYGLARLINASGTETVFGASPVSEEVVAAIAATLRSGLLSGLVTDEATARGILRLRPAAARPATRTVRA